ncbi:hypothetical protein [Salipiger abyssi]|uniref:hypothetical protein n=1 Tax=Salipiger abyssi TaxID=1250539 RepID=UPI00405883F6
MIYATGWTFGVDAGRDEVTAREHYEQIKRYELDSCSNLMGPALAECVTKAIESAQGQSESRQDLYAQKDMAKYTFWVLLATCLTVGITGVGVYFVKRTLDATITAVEETSAATQAMREANQIARRSADIQTRPFLLIDVTKVQVAVRRIGYFSNIFIQVPVKNYGITPAYDPNVAVNCWGHTANRQQFESYVWSESLVRSSEEKGMAIGPQEPYTGTWPITVIDAALIPERRSSKHLYDLPPNAQFSANPIFADSTSYPIRFKADILFTYLDMFGVQKASEFYRLDCTIEKRDEFFKARVMKVTHDPQGAGDIYPIG